MLAGNLGHYRIRSRLGVGGMGEVYRVEDTRLGREVALKVLRPEIAADGQRLGRFQREARLLAALDHPAIVTIFSVEEVDGVHFFTMQLVEGETLEGLIPPGGLPFDRFLEIAVPVTEAVAAAHQRGVIHRDLKPSNIMCTADGRVKILDFGLGKLSAGAGPEVALEETSEPLSNARIIVGTLPYMSPEQLTAQAVDLRSDVFSLGVVLHEMATGQRPFAGSSPLALLAAIMGPAKDVRSLKPSLPDELGRIIRRCLEKNPDDRFESARGLWTALRKLSSEAETQRQSAPVVSAVRPAGPSIGVLPFASLSSDPEDEYFADGIAEEIINALGSLPQLKVAARTSTFSFKGKAEDLRVIGDKLCVTTILEGSVRRAGKRLRVTAQLVDVSNGYHIWSDRYDREMVDLFEIQEEIARSIASRLTETLLRDSDEALIYRGTDNVDAFRLYAQGHGLLDQRSRNEVLRAVRYFEQALELDAEYALAWAGLSNALLILEVYGLTPEASVLARARAAADRALEINPALAEAHAAMGLLHEVLHDAPAIIESLQRAVELRPGYADAHNWLSWINLVLGRPEPALRSARRAVELNPLSAEAVSNLSFSLLINGRIGDAIREARRAAELQPDYDTAPFYEAVALVHQRSFDEAITILERVSLPWDPAGPAGVLAIAETARGNEEVARAVIAGLQKQSDAAEAGIGYAALGENDAAFRALETVERWTYWPTMVLLNKTMFGNLLDGIRNDRRYGALLGRIASSWGIGSD